MRQRRWWAAILLVAVVLADPGACLPARPGRRYGRVRVTVRFSGLSDSSDLA